MPSCLFSFIYTMATKLASSIYNDIYSGLQGMHIGNSLSIEQLEDEIVTTRLAVIKEYQLKGILPLQDLLLAINCVPVDCKDLERCCLKRNGTPQAHFEIPQIIMDYGQQAISYIGTADRMNPYIFYIGSDYSNNYQQYRKRKPNSAYVYIDTAPNEHNMYDGWIFNAPFVKQISVVAAFKDLRQLEQYACCSQNLEELQGNSLIDNEVRQRLTREKLQYYRQYAQGPTPNNQAYK